MKKIAFIMPDLRGGGAEKVLIDILRNIDKVKFKITLILLEKEGVYVQKIPSGIEVIEARSKLGKIPKKIWIRWIKYSPKSFYRYIIKDKFDTEIAFMEGFATKLVANSSNNSSKKIAWIHTDLLNFHWTKKIYINNREEENCYNLFEKIIFVSNDAKTSFKELFNENKTDKMVIYNPIIEHEIIEKSNQFNIEFNEFTLISVGRLIPVKGYDRLIKVHSELVKEYPHKLIILGEGKEKLKLEELITRLGVDSTVELKGFKKNPYPYIKKADLFISSSKMEGYPLVISEAIILEKAIIATNTTGPREILLNGEYGIICENSEEGIKDELKSILEDKTKIELLEKKSRERKKYFNYIKIIKEIENIIN